MKIKSPKLLAMAIAGLALLPFASSQALVVVLSGGTDANGTANLNQLESFLTANFTNVTEVRKGDFANFSAAATQTALTGADMVIIGRTLGSAAYQNVSTGYNSFAKPVIALTSYVARAAGNRLGWHTGEATHAASSLVAGAETTVTAAGATVFNLTAGTHDFYENNGGGTFNGLGLGTIGGGDILATINGEILAARWDTGDAPGNPATAGVATFPAPRLLFNLDNDPVDGTPGAAVNDLASLTATGRAALIASFASMGLTPVPEPSAALLLTVSLLGGCISRRRRR